MTLTGLATSILMGLMDIVAFFEDLEEKKPQNMERRFDGLGRSVGSTCGRVRRVSSYRGLTIEFYASEKD